MPYKNEQVYNYFNHGIYEDEQYNHQVRINLNNIEEDLCKETSYFENDDIYKDDETINYVNNDIGIQNPV